MAQLNTTVPVSYTHLDVYKRQVYHCDEVRPFSQGIYQKVQKDVFTIFSLNIFSVILYPVIIHSIKMIDILLIFLLVHIM